MNNRVHVANTSPEQRGFPRHFIMALAVGAMLCYGIAAVKFNSGAYHSDAYVEAYTACVNDPLFGAGAVEVCKTTLPVNTHFVASDDAYASGISFLSFAISLTVAVLLSPLTHRVSRWTEHKFDQIPAAVPAVASAK